MIAIKGITVTLYDKVQIDEDAFHRPVYKEIPVEVDNVLIAPVSTEDIINQTNLSGKKAVYTLAIPKMDTHDWEDRIVEFFGAKWHTVGFPIQGIEEMIPLKWNKKVTVEKYE